MSTSIIQPQSNLKLHSLIPANFNVTVELWISMRFYKKNSPLGISSCLFFQKKVIDHVKYKN